jgi:hypothetical protein
MQKCISEYEKALKANLGIKAIEDTRNSFRLATQFLQAVSDPSNGKKPQKQPDNHNHKGGYPACRLRVIHCSFRLVTALP